MSENTPETMEPVLVPEPASTTETPLSRLAARIAAERQRLLDENRGAEEQATASRLGDMHQSLEQMHLAIANRVDGNLKVAKANQGSNYDEAREIAELLSEGMVVRTNLDRVLNPTHGQTVARAVTNAMTIAGVPDINGADASTLLNMNGWQDDATVPNTQWLRLPTSESGVNFAMQREVSREGEPTNSPIHFFVECEASQAREVAAQRDHPIPNVSNPAFTGRHMGRYTTEFIPLPTVAPASGGPVAI